MLITNAEPLATPTYHGLEALRRTHPAWKLLRADHAPLMIGFLNATFIAPNRRTIAQAELASRLELRRPRTDGTHPLTGVSPKYHQVADEVAFKELTALVAIDRATGLKARPMDTIVAQRLVIATSAIARRSAAEHAELGDIGSGASALSNAATEAREVGLDIDASELDRARIALDNDHALTSKMMRNQASSQSRTRRRRPDGATDGRLR